MEKNKIVNQTKIYIYGELYPIDQYQDGSWGYADIVFADSLEELKSKLKELSQ